MSKLTEYRIVISGNASENELRAAAFLRENIRLVCGKKLPLVRDDEPPVPLELVVGETARETLDGISFGRYRNDAENGIWEYVIRSVNERVYLTGLGLPPAVEPPYTSAYRLLDDGRMGTVLAAYHFVEDVLGYDFVYAAYEEFPENPSLEMPLPYEYRYTREVLRKKEPILFEGAAMYSLACAEELHWNMGSMILKTASGRLVVIDGGHEGETDRFLAALRKISGEEIPHVTAWLFSHMHRDHWGVYYTLCTEEKYRGALTVGDFYCNLLTDEFYTTLAKERDLRFPKVRKAFYESESVTGAKVHVVETGDVIEIDELRFDVLHVPSLEHAAKMNMNDSSVVYKMAYTGANGEKQTMMLLGDAEFVCNNDLVENHADELASDIVQVGHHGCGNVSRRCYELIGAKAYLWQIGPRFWYSDGGEGLNTHNTGVIRTRAYMMGLHPKKKNIFVNMDGILSLPLPVPLD